MKKIKSHNAFKVLDIKREMVTDETINYLETYFCTYRDQVLDEHILNIDDADEYIEMANLSDFARTEITALSEVCARDKASYIRFTIRL